jgi:hypothetical protein
VVGNRRSHAERFARDIARRYPDWDLIRESEALRAGATLIFPDFLLRHRVHVDREVLIEIVGFWTQLICRRNSRSCARPTWAASSSASTRTGPATKAPCPRDSTPSDSVVGSTWMR